MLAPRAVNVEDLFPKPVKKNRFNQPRNHPVLFGKSPNFYFLVRGKKKKKKEVIDEPVNKHIINLAKKSKKTFLKDMEKNMSSVREFLTFVIGPRMLPLISSIEEAREVLQEITGGEVNSTMYSILMRHANHAAEIKVASFISEYLELDDKERERFLERLLLEKQSVYDLLKMQKMGAMQRSREGNNGVQLRPVPSIQRRNKIRRTQGI